jgi:FlaA1/EpsC-like NDP-sugar epimerase
VRILSRLSVDKEKKMLRSIVNKLLGYNPRDILEDNSSLDLHGKNVLITGGTSGIGAGGEFYARTKKYESSST